MCLVFIKIHISYFKYFIQVCYIFLSSTPETGLSCQFFIFSDLIEYNDSEDNDNNSEATLA